MIINQDIKPEKQAYVHGARILQELLANKKPTVEAEALYITLNTKEPITYHAFAMAMNWLFLLGALDHKNGKIIKCF